MLKTVSSITNAIGALNFKGTWDANANSPALASSVGTKGDYYVVGTAGSTNLNGISNWGVGDLATFNGSVWQRVEGGADLNGVNLSVSGTSTLSGLTASTALALNASKEIVSVTNTGTGDNVLATAPTLVGDVSLSTGNLVIGTAGKGIDFSADPSAAGMTSELLDDYEEGTFTPTLLSDGAQVDRTYSVQFGRYTKIGNRVLFNIYITLSAKGTSTGSTQIGGLPFTSASDAEAAASIINSNVTYTGQIGALVPESQTVLNIYNLQTTAGLTFLTDTGLANNSLFILAGQYKT
jgi:hypothetical protein